MHDRKLQNAEFLGILPCAATCSQCGKKFKVGGSGVHTVQSAEKALWDQLKAHICEKIDE